jgi:hypothetical protein
MRKEERIAEDEEEATKDRTQGAHDLMDVFLQRHL